MCHVSFFVGRPTRTWTCPLMHQTTLTSTSLGPSAQQVNAHMHTPTHTDTHTDTFIRPFQGRFGFHNLLNKKRTMLLIII